MAEGGGLLKLVEIDYQDPDFPEGFENHLRRLQETVNSGGVSIGAFDNRNRLIGFSALNRAFFGKKYRYALLDQLFVSLEFSLQGL